MSEIRIGDNPPLEMQMGVLVNAINHLIVDVRDIKTAQEAASKDIGEMKFYQREQNSNVANAVAKAAEHEKRLDKHDDWHGREDDKVAARVNKTKGRNEVLIAEWKVVTALLGTGILGALAGKIGNILGWW